MARMRAVPIIIISHMQGRSPALTYQWIARDLTKARCHLRYISGTQKNRAYIAAAKDTWPEYQIEKQMINILKPVIKFRYFNLGSLHRAIKWQTRKNILDPSFM